MTLDQWLLAAAVAGTLGGALWTAGCYADARLTRIDRALEASSGRTEQLLVMTRVLVRRRERQRERDAALEVFRLTDEQADAALAAYREPDDLVDLTPVGQTANEQAAG